MGIDSLVTAEDVAEATGRDVDEVKASWRELFGDECAGEEEL